MQMLIDEGANINIPKDDGETAVLFVTSMGNVPVLQLLINNRADINIADNYGRTPMSLARANDAQDVVRLFEPQFHLAFAMVLHVKLGAGSDARFLDEDLLKMIIRFS